MKQKHYNDGSPSREIEDDPQEECTYKTSIIDVRDELNNMHDLVGVCGCALLSKDAGLEGVSQQSVSHVLFFYVQPIIKKIEKELSNL